MKTALCFTFILLIFLTLAFVQKSFAQATTPHNMVRVIYFVPRGRTPQRDINAKLDTLIKDVQTFFADEMERHGFGRKTFVSETDTDGKVVVHHLNGQFSDAYYQDQIYSKIHEEVTKQFDSTKHVYLVAADFSSESLGIRNQGKVCGKTDSVWRSNDRQTWRKDFGDIAVIPAAGDCFNSLTTGHELGHAFGLVHDFRDDAYLMGYGTARTGLSDCAAEWLSVHPFLNTHPTGVNQNTTLEMLSLRGNRLRFQVSDADGLHQAKLQIPATVGDLSPGIKLHSCQALDGKINSTVEFVVSELAEASGEVTLRVIDVHGYITKKSFPIQTETESVAKIIGPWLWIIAPTARRQGGKASINVDSLAAASGGTVTEADVAINGATAGNTGGNYVWTLGEIAAGRNNINVLVNKIGMVNGGNRATIEDDVDINDHSSYALITLESATAQSNVTMRAGSDDAIKIWLNGEVVHNNPINRGANDFQDTFKVDLKADDNLLMVKVSEGAGRWSMFVGIAAEVDVKQPSGDTVGGTTTSTPSTDANGSTTVRISPSLVQSPAIGEPLTLTLHIADGTAVAGYQATVNFDTTALRYIRSENGDYLSEDAFFLPPTVKGNTVLIGSTVFSGESNGDGTLATLTFEVVVVKPSPLTLSEVILSDSESQLSYPDVENGEVVMPTEVIGDVNGDGVVNIQDLVIVASNFGQTGQTTADVNGDDVVNIADLVKVAGAIGNVAAAPSTGDTSPYYKLSALEMFTAADVQLWLTEAQHLNLTDATSQRGILMLERLLAALVPKEMSLLPNYPNPFNPETWIPYQLAKPADVTVSIYAVDGQRVRRLALGHQPAGIYRTRSRAAYWDGKNGTGESVASGIYFYTLIAGDFTATRKMLIRK